MKIKIERVFQQEDLQKLIAKLFLPNVVPVYKANQSINVTNTPFYVTVSNPTSLGVGTSIIFKDEVEYSKITRNMLFSVMIIGKGAKIWSERIQASLRLSAVVSELKALNIGILQMSAIRELNGAFDAGYEERSQFDLLISADTIVKSQLNAINSVELESGLHIEQ